MQKPNPLSNCTASHPLSLRYFLVFSTVLSHVVCPTIFPTPLPRLLFHIKFLVFNSERKKSMPAKKCVTLNLSLIGFFTRIDSISCFHPGSSMLSSTLNDRSFLPPSSFYCLSDNFSYFFSMFFF